MVKDFCEKVGFPAEAAVCLDEAYRRILSSPAAMHGIYEAMDSVYCGTDNGFVPILEKVAKESGVHRYTSDMVFWILCTKPLFYIYKQKNLPESMYWETVADLKYKLIECHNVYGIWGTFVDWFKMFYTCERMPFGRLQFDNHIWGGEDYKGILKNGDACFSCHIPSSGPLTPESVVDSFKKLYAYHKDNLKDGILKIVCYSWLLYPPTIVMYPEDSNTRKFFALFDVISTKERETASDFWRIFNMVYEGEESLDRAPSDTRLRRNYIEYLKAGGKMGSGIGVILFDGEKFL